MHDCALALPQAPYCLQSLETAVCLPSRERVVLVRFWFTACMLVRAFS